MNDDLQVQDLTQRLIRLETKLEEVNKKLDDLIVSLQSSLGRLDNHITSIETIYSIVKRPFSSLLFSGNPLPDMRPNVGSLIDRS